jgi:hypothetical protein
MRVEDASGKGESDRTMITLGMAAVLADHWTSGPGPLSHPPFVPTLTPVHSHEHPHRHPPNPLHSSPTFVCSSSPNTLLLHTPFYTPIPIPIPYHNHSHNHPTSYPSNIETEHRSKLNPPPPETCPPPNGPNPSS